MEFSEIMWLGGIAGSGKTTISNDLANEYNILVYHTDDFFNHQCITETTHPYMWNVQHNGWDTSLNGEPKHDAEYLINHSKEVCEIFIAVARNFKSESRILVEGVCLFPELLLRHNISNSFFITQSLELYESLLKKNIYFQQNIVQKADNPELKYRNIVETYAIILKYIEEQIYTYHCSHYRINSNNDRMECVNLIKKQFRIV